MCDAFTLENVRIVTQAIADYVKSEKKQRSGLVIGYDTRFFAERFAEACASVLAGNGMPVYLVKRAMPTPITAYAIGVYGTAGAIMLTASHNPPEYNGIKFIPDYAGPATSEITKKIEENIGRIEASRTPSASLEGSELVHFIDPVSSYVDHLKKLVDFDLIGRGGLKVVVDPMYGAGQGILKTLLEKAGCEVYPIHDHRDAFFGGSLPDPSLENLQELRALVLERKADLGLALDGDADRFGVVDSLGIYLSSNQVLTILCLYLFTVRGFKGSLVRTVATTHSLDRIAAEFGVKVEETPVGFKYVGEIMRGEPVVLGGEESGGLSILGHIPEKDGLLADLLMAEVLAYWKKPLSHILEDIYREYGHHYNERLDVKYPQDRKHILLAELKSCPPSSMAGLSVEGVITKDGVKYLLSEGSWILIRPSGTEPLIRVYIESTSKERFEDLKEFARELLEQ